MQEYIESNYNYPFTFFNPENHPFGIGIISKKPFSIEEILSTSSGTYIKIVVNKTYRLIFVHTIPPMSSALKTKQYAQINRIFKKTNNSLPEIVIGDFNAVPWNNLLLKRTIMD